MLYCNTTRYSMIMIIQYTYYRIICDVVLWYDLFVLICFMFCYIRSVFSPRRARFISPEAVDRIDPVRKKTRLAGFRGRDRSQLRAKARANFCIALSLSLSISLSLYIYRDIHMIYMHTHTLLRSSPTRNKRSSS